MVEKILNNTTPYGKIRAPHEGSLHSSTLKLVYQLLLGNGKVDSWHHVIVILHKLTVQSE